MTASRKVILIGASGLVGSQLLDLLLKDPEVSEVSAPTRRPLSLSHAKLSNPVFLFDEFDLHADKLGQADDLYFCYGSTLKQAGSKASFVRMELDQAMKIIQVCVRVGVKRIFMVSAAQANVKSLIFYNRIKGQLEDFVHSLLLNGKITDAIILRPSLLLGDRKDSRPVETLARTVLKPFLFVFRGPLRSLRPVWDQQVAQCLLRNGKEKAGRGFHILGNEVICEETA